MVQGVAGRPRRQDGLRQGVSGWIGAPRGEPVPVGQEGGPRGDRLQVREEEERGSAAISMKMKKWDLKFSKEMTYTLPKTGRPKYSRII